MFAASQRALVETVVWGRLEETENGNGSGDAGQRGCQSFYSLAFKKLSIPHHCISPSAGLRACLRWENSLQPPRCPANKPHQHRVYWSLHYRPNEIQYIFQFSEPGEGGDGCWCSSTHACILFFILVKFNKRKQFFKKMGKHLPEIKGNALRSEKRGLKIKGT